MNILTEPLAQYLRENLKIRTKGTTNIQTSQPENNTNTIQITHYHKQRSRIINLYLKDTDVALHRPNNTKHYDLNDPKSLPQITQIIQQLITNPHW